MDKTSLERSRSAKRNATACEHCRAAKAKCQPSEQPGVCVKWVYQTSCSLLFYAHALLDVLLREKSAYPGRVRDRAEQHEVYGEARAIQLERVVSFLTLYLSPFSPEGVDLPAQTRSHPCTFSIDCSIPARSYVEDGLETLRRMHDDALEDLFNDDDSTDKMKPVRQQRNQSVSSGQSRSISDIWRKPEFNLASAEALLDTFSSMLAYLPFVDISVLGTITHMAETQPFILLAIMTVASRSRTVQKHSLYDEEFLKVLGLKYVSGGERSLQLLQGLLIYCAWCVDFQ